MTMAAKQTGPMRSRRHSMMRGIDQIFLEVEKPEMLMSIASVWTFEGELEPKSVRDEIVRLVRLTPRLTQVLDFTVHQWTECTTFDLDDHIVFYDSELPSKNELQAQVSEIMSCPLDRMKPLWDVHVLRYFDDERESITDSESWDEDDLGLAGNSGQGENGDSALKREKKGQRLVCKSAVLFRMHHCVTDGQGGIHMFLTTVQDKTGRRPFQANQQNSETKSATELKTGNSKGQNTKRTQRPKRNDPGAVKQILAFIFGYIMLCWTYLYLIFYKRKSFLSDSSKEKKVCWSKPISLSEVKAVKNAMGATVNDVMLGVLGSALGRYLADHPHIDKTKGKAPRGIRVGEEGDDIVKSEHSERNRAGAEENTIAERGQSQAYTSAFSSSTPERSLYAGIPVSLRAKGDFKLYNETVLVYTWLPLTAGDAHGAIRAVQKRMEVAKVSPERFINYFSYQHAMPRLPSWLTDWVTKFVCDRTTLIVTNVPGPGEELAFAGKNISEFIPIIPQPNSQGGLGCGILSYGGHIQLSINTDKVSSTDTHKILRYFCEDFEKLKNEVL